MPLRRYFSQTSVANHKFLKFFEVVQVKRIVTSMTAPIFVVCRKDSLGYHKRTHFKLKKVSLEKCYF